MDVFRVINPFLESIGGIDTVKASVSHTLSDNVENLVLTGSSNSNGIGNTLNNTLTGNAGNNLLNGGDGGDTLDGGKGEDTLVGGAGNDTYLVEHPGDVVLEAASPGIDTVQASISFNPAGMFNIENLTLTGTANINATGNDGNNVLTGNTGNNELNGAGGNDTASYANAGAAVQVNLGLTGAQATGGMGSDSLVGVENLTGSIFDDTLIGNAGANILNGGAGVDLLIGGQGNDIYVVDSAGDRVVESISGGTDTVQASVSYVLDSYSVENLTLTGSDNLSGICGPGIVDNIFTGNVDSNFLSGGGWVGYGVLLLCFNQCHGESLNRYGHGLRG